VTQALSRGAWVQRPVDILYEGHAIRRDQARELFPDADLDGAVVMYEEGYLSGNIKRDPVCHVIWDRWDDATREQRELTTSEARHVAQLLDLSRARYDAAWNASPPSANRDDSSDAR
jgi:hypothetical protein